MHYPIIVMNNNISVLSRQESVSLKGFLILLIIIGHNMFFTLNTQECEMMGYLYCFHIEAFFILPFLYGARRINLRRAMRSFVKLYGTYMIWSTVLYVCYYVCYGHHTCSVKDLMSLWIYATGLKEYTGILILWFLPAMFSLSLLKDVYYSSPKWVKIILLAVSICSLSAHLLSLDYGHFYTIFNSRVPRIPFGIWNAFQYVLLGVVIRRVIVWKRGNIISSCDGIWLLLIWILLSITYFVNSSVQNNLWVLIGLRLVFPVCFYLLYDRYKSMFLRGFFLSIGKTTFEMYIFHPFIGYILFWAIPDFMVYSAIVKWCIIIASLFCVTVLSYWMSLMSRRIPVLHGLLFPSL